MKFIDINQDPWSEPAADDAVSSSAGAALAIEPASHLLLGLDHWLEVRERWPLGLTVGVMLPNDVPASAISSDLSRLALVALQFPKWTDGRAYSQAHLLRARYRYTGEVRATGEVLVDMLPLLQRNGVDAVVLRPDQSLTVAARALTFFSGHYQSDVCDVRSAITSVSRLAA